MSNRETREAQNPALLAASRHPDVLIWRQQSGVFKAYSDPTRVVRVGQPGMSDAGMIVAVTITPEMVGRTIGVAVQPEFKTSTGKQADAQRTWQRAVERCGGIYRLVRSGPEIEQLIQEVRDGTAWR